MYTIGQISEMFQLPISTLRYYDKEGLFPDLERSSGIRRFSEKEIEALRVIECLKKSGLEIKDIKLFMEWCSEGSATYQRRKELFERQKEIVQKEIAQFKCWYYDQAVKDGNEDRIQSILPDRLPEDIQKIYNRSHNDQ